MIRPLKTDVVSEQRSSTSSWSNFGTAVKWKITGLHSCALPHRGKKIFLTHNFLLIACCALKAIFSPSTSSFQLGEKPRLLFLIQKGLSAPQNAPCTSVNNLNCEQYHIRLDET